MEPRPWYHSAAAVIAASLLMPPLGLILLWTRRSAETSNKVFGSLAIIAVGGLYAFLALGPGILVRNPDQDAHYDQIERHRAQQRAESAEQSTEPGTADGGAGGTAPTATPVDGSTAAPPAPNTPSKAGNYWTDFRGPARDGRYDEQTIRTAWPSEGLKPLWKQPVGGGYASFVVAEGTAFTIEQRRGDEVVAAYDLETGREIWTHSWRAEFRESAGGDGPRATPTWDNGRLYALGATGEFRCLDGRTGKLFWSRNILTENQAKNLDWGMAASPLIVDDKVVVLPGGPAGKSVVAYNKVSGQPVWKVLDDQQAYTSPMLVTLLGKRQILVVSARRAMGLAPDNGALLWVYPWVTDFGVNSAQPIVVSDNSFFISSGYGHGAALIEIIPSGSNFEARAVWENRNMKNKFNSSVLYEGHVYGFDDSIFACIDVQTGERKWKGGRYGFGQVILAGDHLIITTDNGDVVLLKATPDQHTEIAHFTAIEGKTWNHPAISGGRLLVRNTTEMACYDIAAR